jgi:imidazolonepropionase-like amidohydrolase
MKSFLRIASALVLAACVMQATHAQQSTLPVEGMRDATPRVVALTNARIITQPGRVIESGTVLIRDGVIDAVGAGLRVPEGAHEHDLGGHTLVAGFIDPAANVGVPAGMRSGAISGTPGHGPLQQQLDQPGARHWSKRVRPELSVAESLDLDADEAKTLRELGFTAALAMPSAGIWRGQSALLGLREGVQAKDLLLAERVAQHAGYELSTWGTGEYPTSLMGAMALIRQTLIDSAWQRDRLAWATRHPRSERPEANLALAALVPVLAGNQPVMFELNDELDLARSVGLAAEFGLKAAYLGTGFEYRVLEQVRRAGATIVLPVDFPEAPEVEKPEVAIATGLADLAHWEQAPANPAYLAGAGVPIALTARGLKEPGKTFWKQLRRAVAAGLSEDQALAALTTQPAAMLGQAHRLGRIAPGYLAHLLVADADLFVSNEASLYQVWIDGVRHELKPLAPADPRGDWRLSFRGIDGPAALAISGTRERPEATVGDDKVAIRREGDTWLLHPSAALFGLGEGRLAMSARVDGDRLYGERLLADGRLVPWQGEREGAAPAASERTRVEALEIPSTAIYPAGEFGRARLPDQPEVLLIRGATLWTNTDAGVIEEGDLLVRRGSIAAVGKGLRAPANAQVIEAAGRHVTAGIIDAHSHTAIARGVNEGSHAVTTEVRIGDVVDATDVNIYRQLAGGVTAANLLHGSANPMGGQNAVIKMRWGSDPRGLMFEGAPPGVKFALGENVKQSNWGDNFRSRYPQSRMGVEQIMLDTFTAARAYGEALKRRGGPPVRRDLRLEAALEILEGRRLVHIHSYVQSEIFMFARLSEQLGFRVATFQHILEGYKVADELARIGAGASGFSDWWGYKMEVYDAIPHNSALLARAGVVTSVNSDSNEHARRLNTEAAKAVRYGGMDEVEALKLVTLNPAIQLGIADRVGALREGLDADLAIWNGHPLSGYSRVEQTWIDGRRYFDLDEDRTLRERDAAERQRLLQKALAERIDRNNASQQNAHGGNERRSGVWGFSLHQGFEAHFSHLRGLYHDGHDLDTCDMQGHRR